MRTIRPELPRPRLERAMTVARDAKVLAAHDPAARIDDRRGQRPLMGSTPTTLPVTAQEPTASKVRTWVGLDVHAATVVACVVDAESGEMTVQRLPGATNEVVAFCVGLPAPTRVAYEAGPTGFGLARALQAGGIWCVIAAPGKIERPAQDKVKTDRRDAERLVGLLMIDGLHAVRVPSGEEEALRDLVRAREDLRGDLIRARHRMGKLLLRHDVRYDATSDTWSHSHRRWLSMVRLSEPGA
jgi:transposase